MYIVDWRINSKTSRFTHSIHVHRSMHVNSLISALLDSSCFCTSNLQLDIVLAHVTWISSGSEKGEICIEGKAAVKEEVAVDIIGRSNVVRDILWRPLQSDRAWRRVAVFKLCPNPFLQKTEIYASNTISGSRQSYQRYIVVVLVNKLCVWF